MDELDKIYSKGEIKQQWYNLVTTHKRERQRHEVPNSSGSGSHDAYFTNGNISKVWVLRKFHVMSTTQSAI